jgi:cbb3-type cytochrome oxidase subunit 3
MVMLRSKKNRLLIFLVVTIAALILFTASLSNLEFLPGQSFPLGSLVGQEADTSAGGGSSGLSGALLSWWAMLITLAFIILIILWIIIFIFRPEVRKYLLSRLISYLVLLSLIAGLIFNLRQSINDAEYENATDPQLAPWEEVTQAEGTLNPPALVVDPPRWLVGLITLALFAIILGIVWWVWNRRPHRQADSAELIAKEAEQAAQAIQAGRDLRDTVMNCYLKMTLLMSNQRDIQREQAMTPREFENHLAQIGFSDDHIRRLTRLFENVRYGANIPTEREEREAVACLSAIAAAYG